MSHVQQATPAQLAQLESYSFLSVDVQASIADGLTLEQLATRAWWAYFAPEVVKDDFDGWVDYAELRGWDCELIDMHLSLC